MTFLKKIKRQYRLFKKKHKNLNNKRDFILIENEKEAFFNETKNIYGNTFELVNTENGKKISEAVYEFIQPLINQATSNEDIKEIFAFGILAWNLSIFKSFHKENEYNSLLNSIRSKNLSDNMKNHLNEYIEKKNRQFPTYQEVVVKYKLIFTKNGINFSVASNSAISQK